MSQNIYNAHLQLALVQRHVAKLATNLETIAALQVTPPITHHPSIKIGNLGGRSGEHDEVGYSSWGPVFVSMLAQGLSSNKMKEVLTIDCEHEGKGHTN